MIGISDNVHHVIDGGLRKIRIQSSQRLGKQSFKTTPR